MSLPARDLSTIEDFLENDAFRTWITERHPEDQLRWQQWLAEHPEKIELYEQAVVVFLALQGNTISLSDHEVKGKTQQILGQIPDRYTSIKPLLGWQWGRWIAAATIVGLMIWVQLEKTTVKPVVATSQPSKLAVRTDEWQIVKNATDQPLVVLLPDNSSVMLSTNSQLRFRKQTNHKLREVFLQGEGFFEVLKNPARPFFVYTANLTTKVLGTSFQVRSFAREAVAYVKVKTGKVTVTPVNSPGKTILLKVNEELKLGTAREQITKRDHFLSDENPSAIITQDFSFNYTPIPEILDRLNETYHMPIRYDRHLLNSCTFTGQLNDVPFLEKIRLICLTIDSTFEIIDNQVIIHSRGCN